MIIILGLRYMYRYTLLVEWIPFWEFELRFVNNSYRSEELRKSIQRTMLPNINKKMNDYSKICYIRQPNDPAHEKMIPITEANSEGSGKHVHPCGLTTAIAVRTHTVGKKRKLQGLTPPEWLGIRVWGTTKSYNNTMVTFPTSRLK